MVVVGVVDVVVDFLLSMASKARKRALFDRIFLILKYKEADF